MEKKIIIFVRTVNYRLIVGTDQNAMIRLFGMFMTEIRDRLNRIMNAVGMELALHV